MAVPIASNAQTERILQVRWYLSMRDRSACVGMIKRKTCVNLSLDLEVLWLG